MAKLKPIKPKTVTIAIKGISPLIMHAWSEKALKMLRMSAAERRKLPKKPRVPEEEAEAATHYNSNGEPGIPLVAFKAALINAAHRDYGIEKTTVKKSLFVPADDPTGIIAIGFESHRIREDIARIGTSQTDVRYRPEFTGWTARVPIQIDTELLSIQDIVDLTNRAGFSVGLCEMRPDKGGEFGRFEVDTDVPIEEAG